MSKEKFTKGPWVAICPDQRFIVGESKEHDITHYEVVSEKTRGELARGGASHYRSDVDCVDNIILAQAYWRDMQDDEAKANAALIAAAPEMYELLKTACSMFSGTEFAKRAESLLAKARGDM